MNSFPTHMMWKHFGEELLWPKHSVGGSVCSGRGVSIREIARLEEANYKSVWESIETARKKLARAIDNSYEELPDWGDYHIKKKHGADGENEKDEEDWEYFYRIPHQNGSVMSVQWGGYRPLGLEVRKMNNMQELKSMPICQLMYPFAILSHFML